MGLPSGAPFFMKILGIETSCDETSMAIVEERGGRFFVEKNLIASQIALHETYGGVVPEVAARAHVETMMPLLIEAGVSSDGAGIDAIAVTAGPGLVPALRIGVELGKTLAWSWGKPLLAVNHLEGHICSVWLNETQPTFPALALLVSGGHTELIFMRDHGVYGRLGATRDDAAGEAFDKVAKLLGLGYPGGPIISKMAEMGDPKAIAFPRPMLESGDFDFSFSGLKTAVSVYLKQRSLLQRHCEDERSEDEAIFLNREDCFARPECRARNDICASFQEAVVETLVTKTKQAAQKHHPASIILSGGVAANMRLREALQAAFAIPVHIPQMKFTTDNAAMIAVAGFFKAERKEFADPLALVADPNLQLTSSRHEKIALSSLRSSSQ